MNCQEEYRRWLARADASLRDELRAMESQPDQMEDAFYRNLTFGTGGLRGGKLCEQAF